MAAEDKKISQLAELPGAVQDTDIILVVRSGVNYKMPKSKLPKELPTGGITGQVLKKTAGGMAWANDNVGEGGTGAVASVNGQSGEVFIDKANIGLPNVNNTSDLDKPLSVAASSAINSLQSQVNDKLSDTDVGSAAYRGENYFAKATDLAALTGIAATGIAAINPASAIEMPEAGDAYIPATWGDYSGVYDGLPAISQQDWERNYIIFYHNGSEWEIQRKEIKNVDVEAEVGIYGGVNLADLSKSQPGVVYWDEGSEAPSTFFHILGPYKIKPSTLYKVPDWYDQQFAFFDINGVYLSGQAEAALPNRTFTSPVGVDHVKFTCQNHLVEIFMLCEAANFPDVFVPYAKQIAGLRIPASGVMGLQPIIDAATSEYITATEAQDAIGLISSDINIADLSKIKNDYAVFWDDGSEAALAGFSLLGPYKIKPSTLYKVPHWYDQQFAMYDAAGNRVGGQAQAALPDRTFTTAAGSDTIKFTCHTTLVELFMLAEAANFPDEFVPYAKSISGLRVATNQVQGLESFVKNLLPEGNPYTATVNPTNQNAIHNAIATAPGGWNPGESPRKKVITVNAGLYQINNSSQFLANPGYPAMILTKDNLHLIGTNPEDCIVDAGLPYNDGDIDTAIARGMHQTIYNWAHNCTIENLTIIGRMMRYTVHQDDLREADGERTYKNCNFLFIGDKSSVRAFGIGTASGSITNVIGGKSTSSVAAPVAIHNNAGFTKKSRWLFTDHTMINESGVDFLHAQNSGSLVGCEIELVKCSFGANHTLVYAEWWINVPGTNDHFNHADYRIIGSGNKPFTFANYVNGKSLAVRSATTGNSSTVRFDPTSSAYDVLIANLRDVYGPIGGPERSIINKYIAEDGSIGLSGKAIGCVTVREEDFQFGTIVSAYKMGLRLGDCTGANKVLRVIIDGVARTITFNKNYTGWTNGQVIDEMNAALGAAGTAYLHDVGRDYYPEITDAMTIATNGSTADPIIKGTVVTSRNGRIYAANGSDAIYGVALDDIPAYSAPQGVVRGKGRVMTKNYIYTHPAESHHVRVDINATSGDKYRVVNGVLIKDNVNGTIRAVADYIVAINC